MFVLQMESNSSMNSTHWIEDGYPQAYNVTLAINGNNIDFDLPESMFDLILLLVIVAVVLIVFSGKAFVSFQTSWFRIAFENPEEHRRREITVESPAESPVESPAESPVESPAESPAEAPAEAPVDAHAEAPVESHG